MFFAHYLIRRIKTAFSVGFVIIRPCVGLVILAQILLFSDIPSVSAAERSSQNDGMIPMEQAISIAQENDLWLVGNRHAQDALLAKSIAAGSLPDPTLSLGVANLATNSLDFGQEPMTQAQIGLSQMFPAGNSLAIRKQQLALESGQFPYQREDRRAKVAVTVGQLWLNAYKAQESITLIEKNRALFEQLVDIAQSNYSSALGKSRQQNIIRAQLELTRLEDRMTMLHEQQEMFQNKLSEWIRGFYQAGTLPDIKRLNPQFYGPSPHSDPEDLFRALSAHPAVQVLEQKIRASFAGIDLAQQQYSPAWGLSAGYGYRADDPMGNSRSDLFSVGVTLSLPLFTANRQDKNVQSAKSQSSSVKTERGQLLRKLAAAFETARARLARLDQRQNLYQVQLIPQIHEQAEATLSAYTNDDGDFAEVVRARIAEMDAQIEELGITVERQKTLLELNYFFVGHADETVMGDIK